MELFTDRQGRSATIFLNEEDLLDRHTHQVLNRLRGYRFKHVMIPIEHYGQIQPNVLREIISRQAHDGEIGYY